METRIVLAKARLYRVFAIVFAVVGAMLFIHLYLNNIQGRVLASFTNPSILFMLLVPFLPAIVLSWIAARMEKKVLSAGAAKKN